MVSKNHMFFGLIARLGKPVQFIKTRVTLLGLFLWLIVVTSCGSPSNNTDTITGTFRYEDSDKKLRPLIFAKVEIHSYAPGTAGWGLAATVSTDETGSISVPVPLAEKGVVYAVKVFASNHAAIVWPNDAVHTVWFHREPGEPGPPIHRTYGTDTLDFDFDFTDTWSTQHYNLAETLQRGNDYANAHRDPNETDLLTRVNVQASSVTLTGTFYDPAIDTLTINSSDVFNDFVILHEYAHFVEEQIGSFVWIPAKHDGCAARDGVFGHLINSPEHAWMEGFADYFAQAVVMSLPKGTFSGSGAGTSTIALLEVQPSKCQLPAIYAMETVENRVAGTLWDLFDKANPSSPEAHDKLADRDLEIFQIFDRELDTYGTGPTICYFYNAWVARGLDKAGLDAILAHHEITSCKPPPTPIWGEFKEESCRAIGVRQWSSMLLNVTPGMNWDAACKTTPISIYAHKFSGADRCIQTVTGIWGQFDVPDSSCPQWGTPRKDACKAIGIRQYSAVLHDIPANLDWEDTCLATPNIVEGQNFSGATRCISTSIDVWGEFDVADSSCPQWGTPKKDACKAIGIRQYSAVLHDIPANLDWEDTCLATPNMVEGQNFSGATRCISTGIDVWGEFDVADSSCSAFWGPYKKDACRGTGVRQYSAILWDIPSGVDWRQTCLATPNMVEGQNFSGATRCVNTVTNIWGEFDVSDPSCP